MGRYIKKSCIEQDLTNQKNQGVFVCPYFYKINILKPQGLYE